MKLSRLFLTLVFFGFFSAAHAAWDLYKTGVIINSAYFDCQLNTVSNDFQNYYFGRFTTGGNLTLQYGEVLTYKNGSSNVCSSTLRYRVYRTCDTAPAFSSLSLGFCCNQGGTDCFGGSCGPDVNNPGDQKWKNAANANVNFISGLTLSGTYIIEVYFEATGDDSGGCSATKYSSNGGVNYRAYFEYDMNDNFTDLDFSSPTWSGDVSNFTAIANSNTSGLTGSESFRTHTVRLNATAGTAGTQSISTQIASWDTQQEWYFWMGRNGNGGTPKALSASNQQAVYLYSNVSDLESGSLNGYRILMGSSGTSFIRLQRIDAGVATTIFTSSTGVPTGLTDYGITFKVTRSQNGVWTIRTSTLPTNGATTQSTPTPNSCPESLSTVNHGSVTDNTYVPASNGYFGFQAVHDSSTEGVQAAEFDNVRMRALPPDTQVQFNVITGSVAENVVLAGNLAIAVDLTNPSGTNATSVQVVLTSGSSSRAGGGLLSATAYAAPYTTQTLTWAAGTSGTKYVYLDPANNTLCDDIASLVFQLQNATGGTNAFVGANSSYTASIIDDDMGYETLISENFNSGTLGSWTSNGTSWTASTSSPIEGSHSARHSTQASAGQTSLAYPVDNANILGLNTTWRFEVSFANDATANNNFQIFLSSNTTDLFSSSADGYAVVIDQSSLPAAPSSLDYIRLYRVDDGAYASTPIVSSTTDWVDNVSSGTRVGFEVTLNDAGTWTLKVDADGGFDALSTLGTGTDLAGGALTYNEMSAFGIRFKYLASASDLMRIDNITVSQNGCKELWYSQGTGASTGAVWASVPVGTGTTVTSGRYDRFIVQSGHNITASGTWLLNDITIQSGGTLTGGSSNMRVHGNWINEGTFSEGSSNVTFKGQAQQSIGFSTNAVNTTFYNLTVDNDGFSVTIDSAAVSVKNVVSLLEGTLQTSPGGLTLLSSSAASASIGAIQTGASLSGNITLQRYIPSIPTVYGNWLNLGCPLTGQTIEGAWDDDMTTSGFPGSDYPSYPFNNIYVYNEPAAGSMNSGYVAATNSSNSLETSRGYYIWLEGAAQNIDVTGAIQSGTFTQSLSYTITSPGGIFDYGWNLMTNPYPSEVDWNQVSSTLTGPRVYYVFDYQTNSYKYRNAATNSGTASRYIPHSQSFLVKVNVAGQSLSYQESYKTNNGTAFERSEDSQESFVALQLSRNGMSDEAMLIFRNESSASMDDLDVYDLESPNENSVEFSLLSADAVKLAQDVRPLNEEILIPVHLDLPLAGTYTFAVNDVQNLPLGSCLYVEDAETGNTMMLEAGQTMTITTNAPYSGTRLFIHGTPRVETVITDATCANADNGTIDVSTPSGNWSVSLTGESTFYEYVSGGSMTFEHLAAGQYVLEVTNNNSSCGSKTMDVVISAPAAPTAQFTAVDPARCNADASAAFSMVVENTTWFAYEVFNSSNALIAEGTADNGVLAMEGLDADVYTVRIETTCNTEEHTLDLRDPSVSALVVNVAPVTSMTDGSALVELEVMNTGSAQAEWTFSNGARLTGSQVELKLDQQGDYAYTVTCNGDCPQSSNGSFAVIAQSDMNLAQNEISIAQVDGGLQIRFGKIADENMNISLFDASGKLVQSLRKNVSAGQLLFIDLSSHAHGVYTLRMENGHTAPFTSQFYKK